MISLSVLHNFYFPQISFENPKFVQKNLIFFHFSQFHRQIFTFDSKVHQPVYKFYRYMIIFKETKIFWIWKKKRSKFFLQKHFTVFVNFNPTEHTYIEDIQNDVRHWHAFTPPHPTQISSTSTSIFFDKCIKNSKKVAHKR